MAVCSKRPELDKYISDLVISNSIRSIQKSMKNQIIPKSITALCSNYYHICRIFESIILESDKQQDLKGLFEKQLNKEIENISLLYRGSRDGFTHTAFIKQSKEKASTFLLVSNEHGYKFGGFTNVPWTDDDEWHKDENAFMFRIEPNSKVFELHENMSQYAVCHKNRQYPYSFFAIFGYWGELVLYDDCDKNQQSNSFIDSRHKTYNFEGNELCGGNVHEFTSNHYGFKVIELELFQIKFQ